ncbi:MAG: hypothetical protein IKH36_00675 [Bacilli bacterium]|nr:hypothetical protein [Bacilli bacterium]MBR4672167.1 hypothetical protein [Bacilli bacterium]
MKKKKKKIIKIKTKRIIFAALSFLLFCFGLTTFFTYGEFVSTFNAPVTGKVDETMHINDLSSDYNYFKGLNYTKIFNQNVIPSETSTGYYNDDYLVKVKIIYDGKDINDSSLVGYVSPLSSEDVNKYIYYKYYALERNSNGTLATDSNGRNYIRVELPDNLFSKRPYVDGVEYGFNGWVCNSSEDTTSGVCNNTKMYFTKANYTRYMDIACDGRDEFTIHLNASWYRADVVTSYSNITTFNSMSMQQLQRTIITYENHPAKAVWNRNYTTMEFLRTYVRGDDEDGYMPAYTWYKTDPNSNSYTYNSYSRRCRRNATCYTYTENTSGIVNGTEYTGGTFEFVPNFNSWGNNTSTTINTYNATYMNLVEDPNGSYQITVPITNYVFDLEAGDSAAGFFYKVQNPTTAMVNTREYYSSDGSVCTNANSCQTAYKLIEYQDSVNKSNGHSIATIEENDGNIVDRDNYYYLVTRDLNIFRYTSTTNLTASNLAQNRPFTVTGVSATGSNITGSISITGNLTLQNDLVIENIHFTGANAGTSNNDFGQIGQTPYIYANSHNLKIGRNVTNGSNSANMVAHTIYGGLNGHFRVIVESGFYNGYYGTYSSGTATVNETVILGSDYDRALNDNSKIKMFLGYLTGRNGAINAGNADIYGVFVTFKCGMYGYNPNGTPSNDADGAGAYISGRGTSVTTHATNGIKIEGGSINIILGGSGYKYNNNNGANAVYVGMSGGDVRQIYGGATQNTTYGNRIINITGGLIHFSVLGGSNSNGGTGSNIGIIDGDTIVYVGGTAVVGDETGTLNDVEAGSVFGAGGGAEGYPTRGSVKNSHVIINGATINNGVYGGGNFGSTGTQTTSASKAKIEILSGTIENVYGGSKSAGFSKNDYKANSVIDIDISGGTIGNVYGGSNTTGDVYGSVDMDITGGTITGNVYGGGKGAPTFVSNNIDITIGRQGVANTPTIQGNIYGGSALGIVNSNSANGTASGNTSVTINNGNITGSVFGGGQGDDTTTPYVRGNVTVTVNNGTLNNVFGGNDIKGTPNGTIRVYIAGGNSTNVYGGGNLAPINTSYVYLNGGTATNVYGGGNLANATTTNVYLQGGNATNIYGGSNQSGTVTTSNVTATSGTTSAIYGGNNLGGTTTTSNVTINGSTMDVVYGGGNEAATGTTNLYLNGGTIPSAYAGGNKAGVTTRTNTSLNGATVTNLYGGSNTSGDVTQSNISTSSGTATNIYGGNNIGGKTLASNLNINGGNINTVYGGGNIAMTDVTTINLNGGTIINAFGGGNEAGITDSTTVKLQGATVSTIYGGSNQSGTVPVSNITATSGTATTIYGGNNLGGKTNTANVTAGGASVNTVYGGGNVAETDTTVVTLSGGNLTNVYGGGNQAGITVSTTVNQTGATVNSIYGGSNQSGTVVASNINLTGGNSTNVYGGNNQGGTTTTTNVNVNNGSVTSIYGGGNYADSTTSNITINNTSGAITNIYGGGNQASVNTSTVTVKGISRVTNLYGGSNQSGTVNTSHISVPTGNNNVVINNAFGGNNRGGRTVNANVDIKSGQITYLYGGGNYADTGSTNTIINNATIQGHVYGGGNQASVENDSILRIENATVIGNVFGGGNLGTVGNDTNVFVQNSNLGANLFAGGNGTTAIVHGNTVLNIGGTTTVANHVFGGGNAAATGTQEANNSTSLVNIAGLTCGGNVYGGANTSVLYGTVNVNIGKNVVTENTLTKGNINIAGTVFGGGEANASGSEVYDFSFISVTTGITINIDAASHNTFDIDGSIFGSGNASSTSGYSNILIKNYGTESNYKTNVSIQRASSVTLENSVIELIGATDRTNEYSDVLFSLSRLDEINLLNNSVLYLKNGTNLVKKFTSGLKVGDTITKETVEIDEDGLDSRNVNNKLFIYEGKNINIATNENITAYGEVSGMTFFGMFSYDRNGKVYTALYNTNYNNDSTVPSSEIVYFTKGSYVLGQHKTNHNYEQDGFYTNYPKSGETDKIKVDYITPTPDDSNYYMWVVGDQVTSIEINLTASKYSTLGTYELPLINFYEANTTFSVLGFNYNELDSDVELVDKDDIPRIAATHELADNRMALVMKTSDNGWLTIGKTTFLTNESYFDGTVNYVTENSNTVPTLLFYLYHSKNLETSGDMGTATISMVAIVPIDDLNNEVKRININVNLSRALYTTDDYEGTITTGKVYEMFAPGVVNITSKSAFTTYYSLFVEKDETIYREGYHRVLSSTYNFPENTKITMIDLLSGTTPEYYYYVVTANDYRTKQAELASHGDVTYPLSNFVRMGSDNPNNHYNDAAKNLLYYDDDLGIAEEEFIFIVDFKEAGIEEDALEKYLLLELRNNEDEIILSVIGVQQQQLFYNLYANKDSIIDVNGTLSTTEVYIGEQVMLNVTTNFVQQKVNNTPIIDTNFYDYRSGIKISILDANDNVVNGPSVMGLSYTLGNTTYYPRFDGTVRINVAERIANVSSNITINTAGSNLASGNYKLLIESFGSPDGIYYGLTSSDSVTIPFTVKNTIYGLKTVIDSEQLIVDKTTGETQGGTNAMAFNFQYSSGLLNPNIRVSLYRRDYDEVYSSVYHLVDFKDFFTNNFSDTNVDKMYLVFDNPQSTMSQVLYLKENLKSGTYKIVFSLYDNNTYIGDVYKYIIIK